MVQHRLKILIDGSADPNLIDVTLGFVFLNPNAIIPNFGGVDLATNYKSCEFRFSGTFDNVVLTKGTLLEQWTKALITSLGMMISNVDWELHFA